MGKTRSASQVLLRILLILLSFVVLLGLVIWIAFSLVDKTNGRLESSGQARTYLLHVPDSYDPTTPMPLVISLHGFAEWPAHQMETSRWNALADQYGFIVVYPSGTGFPKRWRAANQTGERNDPAIDVRFISDLIDQLAGEYNLDPSRIYANGLSNGGGMSYVLACQLSQRIAAIGGVSGAYLYPGEWCQPARPVPLIAFHGTADEIVPYLGVENTRYNTRFPVIPEWIAGWAARNGCDPAPLELPAVGEVSGIRYTQCQQEAEVVLYTIQGGGHSWPGGVPLPEWIVGHTTQDINASQVMWEFFQQHPLVNR